MRSTHILITCLFGYYVVCFATSDLIQGGEIMMEPMIIAPMKKICSACSLCTACLFCGGVALAGAAGLAGLIGIA